MINAFLVGCPRSGTTWLQMLLAQHPAIATTQETHLFDGFIAPLQDTWKAHQAKARRIGLQAVLTRAEFDGLCSEFACTVLSRIAQRSCSSSVVLEKTPAHVRHAKLIIKLLPEARFIHLIRDPRAVVASLCAAGRSWGRSWASTDPVANARLWVSDVSAGRKIACLTEHHYTLKYEDLLGDHGLRVLKSLFQWLDLGADDAFCHKALADCTIDRLRHSSNSLKGGEMISDDPAGFYRKGKADSWSRELSSRDRRVIEYIAGDLMQACGYVKTAKRRKDLRKPFRLRGRDLMEGLEWRTLRAVGRSFYKARRLI